MKKVLLAMGVMVSMYFNAQKNTLLQADFWKSKPNPETVKAEIAKGNNPTEFNSNTFNPTTLAITNGAPLSTIKFLVEENGNNVNQLTHDGRIYLHWATMTGNAEVVDYLISKGSDVNLVDTKGQTPLTFAAGAGVNNPKVYELLFNAGVQPKQKYKEGATILLLALGNDTDGSLLKLFQSKGLKLSDTDNKGNSVLDYAASFGNLDLMKALVAKVLKPHDLALINAAQGTRRGANGLEVFKYLIDELKVNPKATNDEGANALQIISKKTKQAEIITYLLSKGVDPNQTDAEGNNAFMVAVGGQDLENVNVLLPKIKNINALNQAGHSALSNAVATGSPEIVTLLLENNADVSVIDKKGNNLGYYLIQSYKPAKGDQKDAFAEKLMILEKTGFNLSAPQKDGNTLLHLAVAKNDINLFKKIAALKIDVNAKDQEKMTALHKAALVAKDDSLLKYLVSIGANKTLKTGFDETAFDLASENETLKKNKVDIKFLQ